MSSLQYIIEYITNGKNNNRLQKHILVDLGM